MTPPHFLTIAEQSPEFLGTVIANAEAIRKELRNDGTNADQLQAMSLAMIFEKPSLRTRVSFEVAMTQLGGHAINLQPAEIGLGDREPVADVARVLSGMADGIMARVFSHATLEELSAASTVPIVNGLSDRAHPCQALADVLTMRDAFGPDLRGRRVAYVGDANNVMRSLAAICTVYEVDFVASGPTAYLPDDSGVSIERDPQAAVAGRDVIYTDTWTSMGQEAERQARLAGFDGYAVTPELVALAKPEAIVLHCLPAHRGEEIAADVIDGPQSRVVRQAHNRLHAQKGLLATLLA